jgi:hypothetical protein
MMKTHEPAKCVHLPCRCSVQAGDKYCSPSCKEAGSEDVEIACQCDHGPCPLTVKNATFGREPLA